MNVCVYMIHYALRFAEVKFYLISKTQIYSFEQTCGYENKNRKLMPQIYHSKKSWLNFIPTCFTFS